MDVYVLSNKKTRKIKIGFTDNLNSFLMELQKEDKAWSIIQKEKYTSKKNAMIRVKQLKNKIK